jgi:PKD repeat protein
MKQLFTRISWCFLALFFSFFSANGQQYSWAKGGGTTTAALIPIEYEQGLHNCTDANGNVYQVSQVNGYGVTADTFSATAYDNYENLLISSYTCDGVMRWAKLITSSTNPCLVVGIAVDTSGHVYIGGSFPNGILKIGADTTIATYSYFEMGIIQLDTGGHFNWLKYLGNNTVISAEATTIDYGGLVIDNNENVHIIALLGTGWGYAPGDTTHLGNYDISCNSSGTLLSVTRLQLDSTLEVFGAVLNKQTNKVYAYGYRNQLYCTCGDVGGDSSTYNFIAAFDSSRNRIWMDTVGNSEPELFRMNNDAAIDNAGDLYFCGGGYGYIVYEGHISYPPLGSYGNIGYVLKIDTAGNFKWINMVEGNYSVGYIGITAAPNNMVAATGEFSGFIYPKLITGERRTFGASAGGNDMYFTVIDSAGNIIKAQHPQGTYDNWGNCITSDKVGNLYIGGAVGGCIPDTLITSYCSVGGNTDFFCLKYGVDCDCTVMPVAAFTTAGTATLTATYTGTTASGIDSVAWLFGDGSGDTGLTVHHTYTDTGTVNLCATVYTSCGYDIHCASLMVNCPVSVTASFTDTGSTTRGFRYTGTTAALDSVVWNFGDGHSANSAAPFHTYSASGTYTVCATAYTGCGNNTTCSSIIINCVPVPAFTHTGTDPVSFTYTGTTTGVDSVVWNFGDSHTVHGATAVHTYSASGTYSVCATAYSICGDSTICSSIVINCAPAASFSHTGSDPVNFTYTGTTVEIDSVTWSFGDGYIATGTTTAHTYSASGTYTVCATAHGLCGNNTSCSILVVNCNPTSSFTSSGTDPVSFTYAGTTFLLDSIVWNFGDGHTATGTTPVHTYSASGTYSVCATVYTACGSNTACNSLVVNCSPTSSFTHTGSEPVNFTYTGSTYGLDSVTWTYGDGSTGSGTTPSHIYSISGIYTVCATAHALCGNNTVCNTITVSCAPVASYTHAGEPTTLFNYTGTISGLDSVVWNFGDGSHGIGTAPTHAYTSIGIYTVCVTSYSGCGNATHCSEVTINCLAAPVAELLEDTGSNPYLFGYIGSFAGYDSIVYDFGDGTKGYGFSTTHTYSVGGTYHPCAIIYTECGSDTICNTVVVHTVGVPMIALSSIQVYPNPTNDAINVAGVTEETSYRITTITGITMQKGILKTGTNTLSLNSYASGIYILEMVNAFGVKTIVRLVKQ